MHQIRDSRPAAADGEIISHQWNTDELSDVTCHENRVRQPKDSYLLLSGKAGSENLSVRFGAGVRPTQTLFDIEKSAAAYLVARGLLSQFQDSGKNVDVAVSTANAVSGLQHGNTSPSLKPLFPRSTSSSSEDLTGKHNSPSATHFSGIETSSLHVSYTLNQRTSSRAESCVSGLSSVPTPPTPQDSVSPIRSKRNCETVAAESFSAVSSEVESSFETTPEDLPALLCSFLFGSPDSVTSCDTAVTILEEDLQTIRQDGSMDFMLSPPASDMQLQSQENEARSCEILETSPSKSAENVVSNNGDRIMSKDAEKQNDEESSKVRKETEQCAQEFSPSTTSASAEKVCRTKSKRRMCVRTCSHVREVQRGTSGESGYHTSSENHVMSGTKKSATGKNASDDSDKTGNADVADNGSDTDEDLVLVPSGE